ncbi:MULTISPECIES: hypothetical protein [Paenibacillus]|uniref:Adhesin domain-containing protein n=1 Tax=Paenibacillus borealis TaxID=160799 RepID=A0ABX3HIF3_PAEBO|nr:hypothetical protein [Paenibacillus borealis]OMD49961.1 hypothetical protein BSK56_08425 [Paenibacillus borealis]
MKKNYKPAKIAALAVFSIVLLAGCRELPGKEAADNQLEQRLSGNSQQEVADSNGEFEEFSSELGQEISEAAADLGQGLSEATANLGQDVGEAMENVHQAFQNTGSVVAEQITADSVSKELVATSKPGSSSTLTLDNAVGEVEVISTTGNTVNVTATIVAHHASSKYAPELFDKAEVSVIISGDELKVSTYAKDSPKKDLWSWAHKKYGYSDFSINYLIELPASVNRFEINNDVGSIELSQLQGTFDISSDVGAITLRDVEVTGKSKVETDTGSIGLSINEMKNGSSLKAKSDIGKISASLDSSLKCTVEASSELGHISGTGSGKHDLNGGGPLLSLSTEIGSISIQN